MKKLKKVIKNFVGMSMVEVMLAGAMAAGLGLVIAKIGQQSQRVSKTAESNLEMMALAQNISYILADKDSCVETVSGPLEGNILSVKKVKDGTITKVYEVNKDYGNNTFKISRMTTESAGSGMVNFIIEIERQNQLAFGGKGIKKKIPLKAILSSDNSTIESCFSDTEDMIETAVKASCQGDSARYDPVTKECYHETSFTVCNAGEVLKQIETEDGKIQNVCVSIIPEDKTCGAGEYLKSIQIDGKVECEALATKTANCGTGQYARSLSNGDLECIDIPKCSNIGILRSNNSTGELYCQDIPCDTTNQYFAGFNSSGNAICKNFPDETCGEGQYVKEIKSDGSVVCGQVPNHLSLPVSNYSFVDGYDAGSNTWSRKDINQIAEQICSKLAGFMWTGSKCAPPSGGLDDKAVCEALPEYKWNGTKCVEKECGDEGVKCNVHCGFVARGSTACTNDKWGEKSWGKINWESCQARCEWWMNKNNKGGGCWIVASNGYCYCRGGDLWLASNESFNSSDSGTCQLIKSME